MTTNQARFSKRIRSQQKEKQVQHDELASFLPFSRLPIELRIAIWTLCLPDPQIQGPLIRTTSRINIRYPLSENPALPHVNREARSVALRYYTPRNEHFLLYWQNRDWALYSRFVDFGNDLFTYPHAHFFRKIAGVGMQDQAGNSNGEGSARSEVLIGNQFFSPAEMSRIAHLRLETHRLEEAESDLLNWIRDWLPLFTGLKSLKFTAVFSPWDGVARENYFFTPRGRPMQRGRLVIKEALVRLNEILREGLEELGKEKTKQGLVWEVPEFEVLGHTMEHPNAGKPPMRKGCAYRAPTAQSRAAAEAQGAWRY